ncbi:hypothetical protein RUMHYD_01117 [Blautia hydrogenotrophica DSM 10507]|uniref:Uncharacterized protein n=1 Tax=Blautia hydrogenotrophica (strain DSM 10507 / JCM 14656 / S5a33) TaxID=476272 RepID=C0CJU7_BLAHS|nr:hypothetical protein RUMHYD_01117 [Blautia hydrogenotrophica DSM 10507]
MRRSEGRGRSKHACESCCESEGIGTTSRSEMERSGIELHG